MLEYNMTLVAQIIHFIILIAILIVIPVLIIKRIFSRSAYFRNIEKIANELTEIRKLLEDKLNK